jgi:hypothetical protein
MENDRSDRVAERGIELFHFVVSKAEFDVGHTDHLDARIDYLGRRPKDLRGLHWVSFSYATGGH